MYLIYFDNRPVSIIDNIHTKALIFSCLDNLIVVTEKYWISAKLHLHGIYKK